MTPEGLGSSRRHPPVGEFRGLSWTPSDLENGTRTRPRVIGGVPRFFHPSDGDSGGDPLRCEACGTKIECFSRRLLELARDLYLGLRETPGWRGVIVVCEGCRPNHVERTLIRLFRRWNS